MVKDNRSIDVIKDLNLDVKFGEIFGIIGVDTNWQSEFVELLTSIRKCCGDEIYYLMKKVLKIYYQRRS